MYNDGKQEAFTRSAGWKDRGLKIATKLYPGEKPTHTPEILAKQVDKSLTELGTDCVDIYYLHAADRHVPFEVTLKAINDLHKAAKFKRFAISNYTAYEVAEIVMLCKHNNWVRPTLYQGMYNAITRYAEAELFPCLKRYGLDFYAYNPLAGGFLTNRYLDSDKDSKPVEGRFSDKGGIIGERYRERYFKDAIFSSLKIVSEEAKKHDITMVQVALRWMVHHSGLNVKVMQSPEDGPRGDGIIIGVSSEKQLEENLEALEQGPLPEELCKKLDEAWKVAKMDTPNYWHGTLKYDYTEWEQGQGKDIEAMSGSNAIGANKNALLETRKQGEAQKL